MPILYSAVGKGDKAVSEYSSSRSSFQDVASKLIAKLAGVSLDRKTLKKDDNHFVYICDGGFTFLCITDSAVQTRVAFAFLEDVQKRWGDGSQASMFKEVLRDRMAYYSRAAVDKLAQVQGQVQEVKEIMLDNIDQVLRRGEKLEELGEKAQALEKGARDFKSGATSLKRAMWCRNVKLWIILIAIVLVCTYRLMNI